MTQPKKHIAGQPLVGAGEMYTPATWTRVMSEPAVSVKRIKQVTRFNKVDFSNKCEGEWPFITLCEQLGFSATFRASVNFALRNGQLMSWSPSVKDSVLYNLGRICDPEAIECALHFGRTNKGRDSRVNRALQLSAGIFPRYRAITSSLARYQMEPFDLRLSVKALSDYVKKLSRDEQIEYFSRLSADELKMRFEYTSDHTQFSYAAERGYIESILTSDKDAVSLAALFNTCGKDLLREYGFNEDKQAELIRLATQRQLRRQRKRPKLA